MIQSARRSPKPTSNQKSASVVCSASGAFGFVFWPALVTGARDLRSKQHCDLFADRRPVRLRCALDAGLLPPARPSYLAEGEPFGLNTLRKSFHENCTFGTSEHQDFPTISAVLKRITLIAKQPLIAARNWLGLCMTFWLGSRKLLMSPVVEIDKTLKHTRIQRITKCIYF
jgi:hypothetical protein